MPEHTADLRNVSEGDTVTLELSNGETLVVECFFYQNQHADPRSGEVRETNIWRFKNDDRLLAVSITDGLKSSPDDPDFPIHNEVWDEDEETGLGYIESLTLMGAEVYV